MGNKIRILLLKEVRFVPELERNLIHGHLMIYIKIINYAEKFGKNYFLNSEL